jgi:hypothetical protein
VPWSSFILSIRTGRKQLAGALDLLPAAVSSALRPLRPSLAIGLVLATELDVVLIVDGSNTQDHTPPTTNARHLRGRRRRRVDTRWRLDDFGRVPPDTQ